MKGIIGGVIFSTPLTLYVVPCFYSLMSHFERKAVHEKRLMDALNEQDRKTEEYK